MMASTGTRRTIPKWQSRREEVTPHFTAGQRSMSSTTPPQAPHGPQLRKKTKVSAPTARRPRAVKLPPGGLRRAMEAAQTVKWRDYWVKQVQEVVADGSKMHSRDERILKGMFGGLKSGTLSRHKGGWARWVHYCEETGLHPAKFQPEDLGLWCSLLSTDDPDNEVSGPGVVRSTLAAMQFIGGRCQAQDILTALKDPCVQGFRKASALTSEKKEAVPFSLFILWQLEKVASDPNWPLGFRLLAGFFLCCAWGSLRFSDGDRTSPFSLCADGYVLRGKSWRTKVCDRGVPFGVLGCGLTSLFPDWGWAHHWLDCLRSWLANMPLDERRSVDFLLPSFSPDGTSLGNSPISYGVAVLRLRTLLGQLGVTSPSLYSAHSAKATLLAWSAQLGVDTSKRARQGHHQTERTVTLYGRDDVFAALQLQEEVVRALREGWRPLRAQLRGALPPAEEQEVLIHGGALHPKEFAPRFRSLFVPPVWTTLSDLQARFSI
jgi:hypothetical protein